MQESAQEVFAYLKGSPLVSLPLALVAGFAAFKTVAYDRKTGIVLYFIVGLLGLFLGEFMLVYLRLNEYVEGLAGMRIFIDLIAAYLGSFFIAAIIHFVKPT